MSRVPRTPSRRPWAAAAVFTLTLLTGAFAPAIAGATPGNGNGNTSHTAPGQDPSGSNGVNHNDTPPGGNPQCASTPGTSGSCSQPQPYSNADQNNTGANSTSSSNPYRSTRNGAPSDNGNGNGQATGKPCAGCVGKADNKNPSGQASSGPTDHNNGYECDGNNGIGQTNPAHTGCTSTSGGGTGGGTGGGPGGGCVPTGTPPCNTGGGGTGGGCVPSSANNQCENNGGGGTGGSCIPTGADNECGGTGGTCTPGSTTAGAEACEGGTGGGENCTPTTVGPVANPEACDTPGSGTGTGTSTGGGGQNCTPTTVGPIANPEACGTGTSTGAGSGNSSCGVGMTGTSSCPACPTVMTGTGTTPASCSTPAVLALAGSRSTAPTGVLAASSLPAALPARASSPASVLGEAGQQPLPFTGSDTETLVLFAIGLAVVGVGALSVGKKPRQAYAENHQR